MFLDSLLSLTPNILSVDGQKKLQWSKWHVWHKTNTFVNTCNHFCVLHIQLVSCYTTQRSCEGLLSINKNRIKRFANLINQHFIYNTTQKTAPMFELRHFAVSWKMSLHFEFDDSITSQKQLGWKQLGCKDWKSKWCLKETAGGTFRDLIGNRSVTWFNIKRAS